MTISDSGDRQTSLYQLTLGGRRSYQPLPTDVYHELFSALGTPAASLIRLTINSPEYPELAMAFEKEFAGKGRKNLILEILWDATASDFDMLAATLLKNVTTTSSVVTLVISTSNETAVRESLFTITKLKREFDRRGFRLVVQPVPEGEPQLLSDPTTESVNWPTLRQSSLPSPATSISIGDLDLTYGHFALKGTAYHVPALTSLKRLAANDNLISQLRAEIMQQQQDSPVAIVCSGIRGAGLEELSNALNCAKPGLTFTTTADMALPDLSDIRVIVLQDLYYGPEPCETLIPALKARGAKDVIWRSLAGFRNLCSPQGVKYRHYVRLPYDCFGSVDTCEFCKLGSKFTVVDNLYDVEQELSGFDSVVFWKLVASEPSFFEVRHWESGTTRYHYHFRILTRELFSRHARAIAMRLRNTLRGRGVVPGWIRKIVCLDEAEAVALSNALAERLTLSSQNDVLRVPREKLEVVGRQLSSATQEWFTGRYGADQLSGKNVILVDQAAHHLRTYSALAALCDWFGATVLAFTVFLDRTPADLALGDFLPNTHFFSLYNWPSGPRRVYDCACSKSTTTP
jgi:adenine/guanine phosphoribosyltransferase-like PRPP-binding protein